MHYSAFFLEIQSVFSKLHHWNGELSESKSHCYFRERNAENCVRSDQVMWWDDLAAVETALDSPDATEARARVAARIFLQQRHPPESRPRCRNVALSA